MVNILLQEYAGKLIKQTREESVVYIDDFMILEKLFNTQEKENWPRMSKVEIANKLVEMIKNIL